jgi:surface polysaccharide O-acyltransferase-like enzyme
VLVHLSYVIFFKEDLLSANWVAANFYDSISRMGVPLFFMVSGSLLLGKLEPFWLFLRKRFVKVGIPTLFWSIFYLVRSTEAYRDGSMGPLAVGLSMLKAIYLGDVEIHLWFLYILVGIYLVVPILRLFVSAAARRDILYFILMWFLATPFLEVLHRLTGFKSALQIPVVAGYVGYFVLGYYLQDIRLSSRGRWLAFLGVFAAVAVTFFGTNLLSANAGPIDSYFYSYFSPPTILAAMCGFLLLKSLGERLGAGGPLVQMVSETSFGIYLIHIFVIEILRKGDLGFRLFSWMGPTVYMIPLTGMVVFLVSFVIVYVMRRIPVIKLLVP